MSVPTPPSVSGGMIKDEEASMDIDYEEPRFVTPICTVQDVADLVGMPLNTVKAWAGQRSSRRQMFTRNPQDHRGWPSVPLVGLVEANTLRTLREMLAPSEVEGVCQGRRPGPLRSVRSQCVSHRGRRWRQLL